MAVTDRYVTDAAGGGGDGSSGTPWTLAEAISNAAAGDRVNIQSDGTYTLAGAATFPNGSSENPIIWRGYNSAIGDLEDVGRATATGALDVTNFPVIDGTATPHAITLGTYSIFENISFTAAGAATTVSMGATAPGAQCWRCKFAGTHASSGSSEALHATGSIYGNLVDCDFTTVSTGNNIILDLNTARVMCYGCRVWSSAGTPGSTSSGVYLALGSTFISGVIFSVGRGCTVAHNSQFVGNTVFDVVDGMWLANTNGLQIVDNIFYSCSSDMLDGTTIGSPLVLNNAGGAITGSRINTTNLGSVIYERDAITLTGDPFTASGSEDFTLNETAGAGALCRGASQIWS